MDSVGEGEGGKIWENGIETCKISRQIPIGYLFYILFVISHSHPLSKMDITVLI